MNYIEYKNLDLRKRLSEIVSLQMKIKKYFVNNKNINEITYNGEIGISIKDMIEKLHLIKRDLIKYKRTLR